MSCRFQVKTCWMAKGRGLIRIAHVHWRTRAVIGTAARLRR
jgi:ligand-binding sensor domain-containing protein